MPRRGENIRKRKDGRWEARIHTEDGKIQSVYARSYSDLKEKLKTPKETQTETEPVQPKTTDIQTIPFLRICEEWLKEAEIKNKKSTTARYRKIVQKHLIPYFEKTPITRDSVNSFILYKFNHDKLQEKTIYDIATVLMQIIKYAENREYIKNFRFDISRPTLHKKTLDILTEEEQEKLVNIIKPKVTYENVGILLSLYSGMRLGEICALQWQDININEGTISITKAMQRISAVNENSETKTVIIIDTPKSQKSVRTIPIPDFLTSDLKDFRKIVLLLLMFSPQAKTDIQNRDCISINLKNILNRQE